MQNSALLCGFVAMLSGVAACASPVAEETVGVSRSPIIGGTATAGTPSVMALYARKPGADSGALCTTTLIAPRVLVTAAHCVATATVGEGAEFKALIGSDLNDANNRPRVVNVTAVRWDEAFNEKAPQEGHDIGIAILEEAITDITPMPINLEPLADSLTGADIHLVGYGLNDGFGQKGAGVKREAMVKLNSFDPTLLQTGNFFGKTICSGDSGGPVLAQVNGVETLIGVNSFGIAFCIGPANSTRVDAYRVFIERFLVEYP